ncbi:MAG: FAD-dependent oxidoreductase, partial [Desulfobacteraceae bacterium]|nr:FAD-dependent oxidoreductase [Desulfobacteraceae bacterium]
MDKKYGMYICTGCGIGDSLDVDALCAVAAEEGFPVQQHPFLCGPEGVALIKKDIAEKGINAMVIGACSRRVNFDIFRFDNCIVERANLREQVVWSHPRDVFPKLTEEEKASGDAFDRVQMLAEDYLRMGMARVKKVSLPEPYLLESLSRRILVLGGGMTGMAAALDAAKAGYEVTIVEKTGALGGHANHWRQQLPNQIPYETLIAPQVGEMIAAVKAEPKITVRLETVVARIAGEPGNFTVTLKKPGEKIEFDVPYPLPPEMRVDEKGNELDVETLQARYKEYNQGRVDILTLDPNGEKFGAV